MIVGDRLRLLREAKGLSQGDIEKRSGLLRCYISRVENGHTVPAVETLEKMARALEIPMYRLFYEGQTPPVRSAVSESGGAAREEEGTEERHIAKFYNLFGCMDENDRGLLLFVARRMLQTKKQKGPETAVARTKARKNSSAVRRNPGSARARTRKASA